MPFADNAVEAARQFAGKRLVSAELMYKPRPVEPRARRVFDFTLDTRLRELSRYDGAAALLICKDAATVESLAHLPDQYPRLTFTTAITNPTPIDASDNDTPIRCGWDHADDWRQVDLTDRWTRIRFALDTAARMGADGWLIMPAHDAVWGRDLLAWLLRLSETHAKNEIPAAVSPYTPYQHSPVPGVSMNWRIIDALNAAFARDSTLRARLQAGAAQGFWGKMGMIPFAVCGDVLDHAEMRVWEDDLEIDRVLRARGYGVACEWMDDPRLYRQSPPVFDRAGLRAVIDRTLHYSLNVPGEGSLLLRPLDEWNRLHARLDPRFARAMALAEAVTAECRAEIAARLDRCGASWVDWGAYRYAARVGDPFVSVWRNF